MCYDMHTRQALPHLGGWPVRMSLACQLPTCQTADETRKAERSRSWPRRHVVTGESVGCQVAFLTAVYSSSAYLGRFDSVGDWS